MNTVLPARDFPLWIPPALVKELRQCMRTPAFMNMLTIVPCSLSVIFLLSLIHTPDGDTIVGQGSINNWFWGILTLCMTILVPNWALGSMRVDIADKSGDLLMLTRLTPRRTVWGKWVAYMALAGLIICTLLPFAIIRYFGGQVSLANDLFLLFCVYVTSAILTAGAIWISGMPIVLRALFSLATGAVSIIGLFTFLFPEETASMIDRMDIPMTLGIMVVDSTIVIACFLLLASRWLSAPSINTVTMVRSIVLLAILPLFILKLNVDWENLLTFHGIFVGLLAIVIITLELTLPASFLPIHIIDASQKRFSFIRKIFFMPGLPSAAAFSFIITTIYSIAFFVAVLNGSINFPLLLCPSLAFSAWYSILVPALILYPFRNKLGIASPILYNVIIYVFVGICGIFTIMKADFLMCIIPYGGVISITKDSGTASSGATMWLVLVSILTAVCAAGWMRFISKPWFRTWKEGSTIAASLRKKSKTLANTSSDE